MTALTPRERQIVNLIVNEALPNKIVGYRLGTTEQTVKNQLSGIYRKLGIRTRLQLAVFDAQGGDK